MLKNTGLSIKGAFAAVTREGGGALLSFGFSVIGGDVLQTGWTVVWIIVTSVLTFVIVRFKASGAEIGSSKKARECCDDVIVLIIVQEDELFFLGRSKCVNHE